MKKTKITILGDGAWGTTLAILLSKNGHEVTVWSVFGDHLDILDKQRENKKYLKGIKISENIIFEKDIKKAIEFGEYIVFSIPSKFFRSVSQLIKKVKRSNFKPSGGWHCQFCDFRDICAHKKK